MRALPKAGLDGAEARAKELRNEELRGGLVPRAEVARAWGRMCAVVTSQIHTVGAKTAPQVCAELGVYGGAAVLKAQEIIDAEVYAACGNLKREMGGYLLASETRGDLP